MSQRINPPMVGQPPNHSRRRFALVMVLAILLPLVAATYFLQRWANAPVEQTVTTANPAPAPAVTQTQTVRNTQYSFTVPAGFQVRSTTDPNNPYLTHAQVFETDQMARQIGVTTNLLPADGLDGVADYHLRKTMTDTYTPYSAADIPAGSQAFANPTSRELTLFMVDGKRYASISVSGVSGNGRLRELFSQVYTSWQWL